MSLFCNTNTIDVENIGLDNKNIVKKVNFKAFNDIYLIPNITELKKNCKINEIWWTPHELHFFKKSFIYSVHIFLKCNPHIDSRVAVKVLLDKGK